MSESVQVVKNLKCSHCGHFLSVLPIQVNCSCCTAGKVKPQINPIIKPSYNTGNHKFVFTFRDIRELSKNGGCISHNFKVTNSAWKFTVERFFNNMNCYLEKCDYQREMAFSYKLDNGTLSILSGFDDSNNYEQPWATTVFGKRNGETMKATFDSFINWGYLCQRQRGLLLEQDENYYFDECYDGYGSPYNGKIKMKLAFSMSLLVH